MFTYIAKEKGIGRGSAHNSSPTQVLERSRRLSEDEIILRLGDGKVVAAEVVGSLSLVVSDHIRIEIRKLVDKSLEIDDLDNLPTRESCLKGKITKKPFVRQSAIINSLLDLIHTDICGSLNTPTRGGYSYFLTFTDDHSRYGYAYLMRYKPEAFGRFKEYRFEVENQTGHKINALWSNPSGEYLSGEFINYSKENGILSQWTPPGMPQLIDVAEKRNQTLLDMVRSMISFIELPPSFWGYTLEMGRKLLNTAPSKTVLQTPYKIWHGKPASYKYLTVWSSPAYVKKLVGDKLDSRSSLCRFVGYPKETVGYYFYDPPAQKIFVSRNAMFLKKKFPTESRCDEMLLDESTETPQQNDATSFEPLVPTDGVSFLRRSIKESRPPERPVGCKWVYKYKLGADEEVTAFKARLVAKGYTQRPGVDFEETYSHVAIAKSMRILFANSIMV
ncbi:UNVERIFIED_CONTAM: Retrovirus-related Pol polyprotein from transposon RE2 [Sesamum radiatum]|uniref:Retrovirus-related Pol polyprotein from transposon RE2 n=1 Tax=Sesamum radiatum TaxID=300843 RepID=A0AAW2L9D5_SESRA